jgi:hypothetical protein
VAWAGGDHLPVEVFAELGEGCGDLDGWAPGLAIVIAALVEAAHVFDAVDEMHCAAAGGDGDGVVDGLFIWAAHVLVLFFGRQVRIARQAEAEVGDLAGWGKGASAIGAAPQVDLDLAAVGIAELPCLAISQHGALGGDDDAGDAVEGEAVAALGEENGFLQQGLGGGEWQSGKEEADDERFHGG